MGDALTAVLLSKVLFGGRGGGGAFRARSTRRRRTKRTARKPAVWPWVRAKQCPYGYRTVAKRRGMRKCRKQRLSFEKVWGMSSSYPKYRDQAHPSMYGPFVADRTPAEELYVPSERTVSLSGAPSKRQRLETDAPAGLEPEPDEVMFPWD